MTFNEWWDSMITDGPGQDGRFKVIAQLAWNAALKKGMTDDHKQE